MQGLDETDLEILSLLAENARRPFSTIGEEVGLSGPAVSDRVTRLQETGVINHFTIDVDHSQLKAGVPVIVRLDLPSKSIDSVRERVRSDDAVEHVFITSDGELWFYGRAEVQNVRTWVNTFLDGVDSADYTVTLIDEVEWTPSIDGVEFSLSCAECSNTVDFEGETSRIGGEIYHFCCPTCLSRFEERHQRLEEGV
ncbi:MAG: AsnC family transcriptional regulator [Natronomonas sp.]